MVGRLLATCGWLAWQLGRPFRRISPVAARVGAAVVAVLLLVTAAAPIVVPLLDPQPVDASVADVHDGLVTAPGTWVRFTGRLYPLSDAPADGDGAYGLLVDEAEPLRAIVARTASTIEDDPETVRATAYTGRLRERAIEVTEELPIQATVAGTPPRIAADRIVELDRTPTPVRQVWWPLAILPALLAAAIAVGIGAGYPVFRPGRVVDVLVAPLGVGERLPTAFGGRIGPTRRDLTDPGNALLLVRRGPGGNLLTAQPLADDGGVAPAPVTIGGGWTSGRIGDVHTVRETVPALVVRSELVDATFLFARTAERDRVAALVAVER
jgi:hypothetical protein